MNTVAPNKITDLTFVLTTMLAVSVSASNRVRNELVVTLGHRHLGTLTTVPVLWYDHEASAQLVANGRREVYAPTRDEAMMIVRDYWREHGYATFIGAPLV